MMRWHARTALASSLAATSIVIGGGFFLPFFLPLVFGEDVVLLSGGGGGGASPALGFFLRGFGFFAFCGSSPFMTSMTIVVSSSLLPFLGRGGMFCGLLTKRSVICYRAAVAATKNWSRAPFLAALVCCWRFWSLSVRWFQALALQRGRSDRAAL